MNAFKNIFPVGLAILFATLTGCDSNPDHKKEKYVGTLSVVKDWSYNESCRNKLSCEDCPPQGQKYERVRIFTHGNNIIKIDHYNIVENCAAEFKIEAYMENGIVYISEKDTAAENANCVCPYELSYNIEVPENEHFNISLNGHELITYRYPSDTLIMLKPYEGPDFYEDLGIWDFSGHDIVFCVTDEKGNDLLDAENKGNILNNEITVTYNNKEFKNNEIKPKYYLPEELAIRMRYSATLKMNLLTFGEFTPCDDLKGETLIIDWGDGTKDEIVFDLYIVWENIYTPDVINKLLLNGKENTSEYPFLVRLVKKSNN